MVVGVKGRTWKELVLLAETPSVVACLPEDLEAAGHCGLADY